MPPQLTEDKQIISLLFSAMKKILRSENPTFKSVFQKHSLQAIMNLKNEHNGLIILPTNAGKSLLYMIPSVIWRDTITVVILPLKSLLLGSFIM
jgi:superfamily II DNA helicase RecQ